jgi:flap endonuclease-1
MGINGINTLIKRHSPDAFFTIPITMLSGKRIAIDANNWMYTNMAVARKKVIKHTDIAISEPNASEIRREWFLSAITFILGWLSHNITPIFVFDGRHPPEKDETKAKRRDQRVALRAEIDALYEQLRKDLLERPANILDQLRKKLMNYNYISSEDFELFKMVIKGIGIPCLQAVGDGERLCSVLCAEQKAAAVFSADTDNLVYGCPLVITKFSDVCSYDEYGCRIGHVECVRLDKVLMGLGISHSVFVDLCIMSGCDFNTNMPGYAAIKSYNLLQKFGSIDTLPRNFNIECLKHNRCRELFKYEPSENLSVKDETISQDSEDLLQAQGYDNLLQFPIVPTNPLDINKRAITTARDYLEMAGVSGQIDRIITYYNQVTPAADGLIPELQFTMIPPYNPPAPTLFLNIALKSPIVTIPLPQVPQPTISIPQFKYLTLNILPQPQLQEATI